MTFCSEVKLVAAWPIGHEFVVNYVYVKSLSTVR